MPAQSATLALDTPDIAEHIKLVDRGIKEIEKTINSCEQTLAAVETSLQYLNRTANEVEQNARHRAFTRLDDMAK